MLIKQEGLSPHRNFDLVTADELQMVFSTNINLLFFPSDKIKVFAEVLSYLDDSNNYPLVNTILKIMSQ